MVIPVDNSIVFCRIIQKEKPMSYLKTIVKAGDILNLEGYPKFDWKNLVWSLGVRGAVDLIVQFQRMVFCAKLHPNLVNYKDNHSMIYLGDNIVFSQEPPKATYHTLDDYDVANKHHIVSVYRMNPAYFGRALTDMDLVYLREGADILVSKGVPYSVGQNVDCGLNDLAGYPWSGSLQWFSGIDYEELSRQTHLHCSMAVASIIAYWRHRTLETTGEDIPQPWKKLNPNAWRVEQIEKYPDHWDFNATHPANFATTDINFFNEFVRIGKFKQGNQIA